MNKKSWTKDERIELKDDLQNEFWLRQLAEVTDTPNMKWIYVIVKTISNLLCDTENISGEYEKMLDYHMKPFLHEVNHESLINDYVNENYK